MHLFTARAPLSTRHYSFHTFDFLFFFGRWFFSFSHCVTVGTCELFCVCFCVNTSSEEVWFSELRLSRVVVAVRNLRTFARISLFFTAFALITIDLLRTSERASKRKTARMEKWNKHIQSTIAFKIQINPLNNFHKRLCCLYNSRAQRPIECYSKR